ncbi:MAG: hypothetical protein K2Y14_14565 [Burkholderiales bacterium]|nr:hypothetical protein [Burkholderiales bacterium]
MSSTSIYFLSSLMTLTFVLCSCLFLGKNSGLAAIERFLNIIKKQKIKHTIVSPFAVVYAIFYASLYIGVMLLAMIQLTAAIASFNLGIMFLVIAYNLLALLLINKFIFQKYLVIYRGIKG